MVINDTHCVLNLTGQARPYNARYFVLGPLLTTIITSGLLGNGFSLAVFYKTRHRPRIYYYLGVLACWDTLLLLSSFTLYSLPVLLYGKFQSYGTYVTVMPIFFTFSNMAHSASIWIVVVLAVERYFALCHPLKYLTWDTDARAKILLFSVSLSAVLYHVPRYFEVRLRYCEYEDRNGALIPFIYQSDLRHNEIYKILRAIGSLLFISLGPLISLSILTTRVSIEVRRNMKLQRTLTGRHHHHHRKSSRVNVNGVSVATATSVCSTNNACPPAPASSRVGSVRSVRSRHGASKRVREDKYSLDLLLVTIMAKFCICHTLPTVLDVCESIFEDDWMEIIVDISVLLVVANSSWNFVVYFASSPKFRSRLNTLGRHSSRYALLKLRSISEGYGGSSAKFSLNVVDVTTTGKDSTLNDTVTLDQ